MVSAKTGAAGRSARFDVPGGPLKLAGRLFRGALQAAAEESCGPGAQRSWGLGPAAPSAQRVSPLPSGVAGALGERRRGRRGATCLPGERIVVVVLGCESGCECAQLWKVG